VGVESPARASLAPRSTPKKSGAFALRCQPAPFLPCCHVRRRVTRRPIDMIRLFDRRADA